MTCDKAWSCATRAEQEPHHELEFVQVLNSRKVKEYALMIVDVTKQAKMPTKQHVFFFF